MDTNRNPPIYLTWRLRCCIRSRTCPEQPRRWRRPRWGSAESPPSCPRGFQPIGAPARPPFQPMKTVSRPLSPPIEAAAHPPSPPIRTAARPPSQPIEAAARPPSQPIGQAVLNGRLLTELVVHSRFFANCRLGWLLRREDTSTIFSIHFRDLSICKTHLDLRG